MTNLQVDLLSPVLWVENKAGPGSARCWPPFLTADIEFSSFYAKPGDEREREAVYYFSFMIVNDK